MKTKQVFAFTVLVIVGVATECVSQVLASRSFDMLFAGDDPSERYDFLLPHDSMTPVVARFDGYFENLKAEETGVRTGLAWFVGGTTWDGRQFTDEMGFRLPGVDPVLGTTHVPFQFEQQINFTPSETHFWIEGLGPADRFQFVGEFSIQAVPEPTVTGILASVCVAALLYKRMSRPR